MIKLGRCKTVKALHYKMFLCESWKPYKDPADDGPEVALIRFFKYFPEGSRYAPVLHLINRAPLAS